MEKTAKNIEKWIEIYFIEAVFLSCLFSMMRAVPPILIFCL